MPSVDVNKIVIDNFKTKLLQEFNYRMMEVLQNEFKQDFIAIFSVEYDQQFAEIESVIKGQGDPTAPSEIKPDVMWYIEDNFKSAVKFENDQVKISLLNTADLGYPKWPGKKEADRVKLFIFYLEGHIGEYAFISNETYDNMKPSRAGAPLGRFGRGFLMPMDSYKAMKRHPRIGQLIPSAQEVRFPLSGSSPTNFISNVMSKIDFNKYINIATKRALENVSK